MTSITITNVYAQINDLTDKYVINKIDDELSYYVPGYNFAFAYKRGNWDGKNHLLSKGLKVQTGLLPYVEKILKDNNIEYTINDVRVEPVLGKPILLLKSYYTPRDYQLEVVEVAKKHKTGIIKVGTGGGKSLILSKLAGDLNVKTIIYVISLDLLYQTKQAVEDALGIKVGIVGDGNCSIKKITIATPWTVIRAYDRDYEPFDDEEAVVKDKLEPAEKTKIKKMVETAQMFIYDECQFMGSSVSQFIAKMSKEARYRIAMSGTPWRLGDDSILLEASTGKQLIDIDASYLIKKGILVQPKIYFFEVPSIDTLDKEKGMAYHQVYDQYIVENTTRNEMIIEATEKLFNKNKKILILVRRKQHGLNLLAMIPRHIKAYYLNGDANAEERKAVKELFGMGGLDIIIASSIFDQGIDLPQLDALILAGAGKSSTRALQRIGRVIRGYEGKTESIVVDFVDNAQFLRQHSKSRCGTYRLEKGFQIKLPEHIKW